MDKTRTVLKRMLDKHDDNFVPGTPGERIGMVWPLTREITSFSKKHDAERRLQRHITRLMRREG